MMKIFVFFFGFGVSWVASGLEAASRATNRR